MFRITRLHGLTLAAAASTCLVVAVAAADDAHHDDKMGVLRKAEDNKLGPVPGMPTCVSMAVETGDPTKGPSIIIFKAASGCVIPWHWHTPTENVMVVSGSAKMEMKDGGSAVVLGPGGFGQMPTKHVHQFTCTAACMAFVSSDAAFDIHYVDAAGKEIKPEAALATKK